MPTCSIISTRKTNGYYTCIQVSSNNNLTHNFPGGHYWIIHTKSLKLYLKVNFKYLETIV